MALKCLTLKLHPQWALRSFSMCNKCFFIHVLLSAFKFVYINRAGTVKIHTTRYTGVFKLGLSGSVVALMETKCGKVQWKETQQRNHEVSAWQNGSSILNHLICVDFKSIHKKKINAIISIMICRLIDRSLRRLVVTSSSAKLKWHPTGGLTPSFWMCSTPR